MTDAPPNARVRALRSLLRTTLALPEPARRAIRGPDVLNDRGDRLDPVLQLLCRLEGLQSQELDGRTPEDARTRMVGSVRVVEGPRRVLARVEHRAIDGVLVRIYVPPASGAAPRPVLVYLHGGGWVCGDLRTHDRFCQRLAADADQIVVAVHYPLAPEAPYPAGLRAIVAVLGWVRTHAEEFGGDPARVAIGGDSAGGNLAAAACLALRDVGAAQPAFQLLLYPGLDLRCLSASFDRLGHGFLLTQGSIRWYMRHYGADPLDPRASPLLEPDLSGLAGAIVVTAGFDPLRDDGEQYAERLAAAGVPVESLSFPAMVHGFVHMDGISPGADRATAAVVEAVRGRWMRGAEAGRGAERAAG